MMSYVAFLVACSLQTAITVTMTLDLIKTKPYQYLGFGILQITSLLIFFGQGLTFLFLLCWLDKFSHLCEEIYGYLTGKDGTKQIKASEIKNILKMHKDLELGLSFPVLFLFTYCQVFSVVNLFNIISFQLNDSIINDWEKISMSVSFAMFLISLVFIIVSITLTVEYAFDNMKKILIPLKMYQGDQQ